MNLTFQALGFIAMLQHRMSRLWFGCIPSNWVVTLLACVLLFQSLGRMRDALSNPGTPRRCSLSEFFDHRSEYQDGRVVTLAGTWNPSASMRIVPIGSHGFEYVFIPLSDSSGREVVFVKTSKPKEFGEQTREQEITGILRPGSPEEREVFDDWAHAMNLHDQELVLDRDTLPGTPALPIVLVLANAAFVLVWGGTWMTHYVVFQKRSGGPLVPEGRQAGSADAEPIDMRAAGKFQLGSFRERFVEVPAASTILPSGELAIAVHVDASIDFGLFGKQRRAGTWILHLSGAHSVAQGFLYYGARRRPALRYQGQAGDSGVLSFASEEQCARVSRELLAGRPSPGLHGSTSVCVGAGIHSSLI